MPDLRTQLEPLIRERGIATVARLAGVRRARLTDWLNGRPGTDSSPPTRLTDEQVEAVCGVLGLKLKLTKGKRV